MKILPLILFSFLSNFLSSQDLHIYYNLHKDSLWYEKNGKPTTKLEVRKGKQIFLHVIEYNNYIFSSENEISYHSTTPPGYESESNSFLGMMPTLINSLVPGGSALLPLMQTPLFGNLLSALSPQGADMAARGSNEDLLEYEEKLQDLENQKEAINTMLFELNTRMTADKHLRSDMNFIKTLTTNPNIAPSLIKSILNEYFSEALMIHDQEVFHLKDIASLVQKMEAIPTLKSDIIQKSKNYESNLTEFKKIHKRIKNSDHGIDTLYGLMKEFENKLPEIEKMNQNISSNLSSDIESNNYNYKEAIQRHFFKYTELQNNNFRMVYHTAASHKHILFNLNIFLRDSNATSLIVDESEKQLYKKLKVKLITYGEFGIATSVGVQGVGYVKTPESYYIANNVLLSEKENKYVPFVASLFNLHYQLGSSFSPAVSFGVGIPLGNSNVIESISYLFGPSLIIGKSKNIIISGGFIFSKVLRLSENLQVGNTLNVGMGQIPTRGRYEQGYFLGISYNIKS